jgi:hypothetical protein
MELVPEGLRVSGMAVKENGSKELAKGPSSLKVSCFSEAKTPFTIVLKQSAGKAGLAKGWTNDAIDSPETFKASSATNDCKEESEVEALA